ncbi:MAG: Hsp20/alpha crystallin family protein [Eubacterium coprostanoligenes]|uniref:Hsp20/alpha crystallin family protein n=1 Tax=Eubacterium coprostanoligenes TaxID=290054 RepID=UPI00240A1DC8|nr:Hsp20/alpha crystallin family protein [Eubacterium coprostanoligenes]MDD6666034.1 Hsp20/alpha crystallin family protein [Eubacterium coprostanoligenes]MDY4699011.1 Hsp20/alpha crystallin family protein [Eubacterium coprostanoligenes]
MLMPSVFGKDLFDDFFDFPFYDDKESDKLEKKLYGHRSKNLMKTDVQETENGYVLEMDLPGFSKDEVKASLKDGYLTIRAEKGLDKEEKDEKTAKYIRRERYAGSCERSFYVGDVNEADIKGEFKHGILKLTIPKEQPKKEIDTTKYIELD